MVDDDPVVNVASFEKFRKDLVDDGAADEIIRALVGLGESKEGKEDPMAFLMANLGQGTLPPVVKPRAPPATPTLPLTSYEVLETNRVLKEKVAELATELKATKDAIANALPEGTLFISGVAAHGVPDADSSGGTSDPYVTFTLLDVPSLENDDDGCPLVKPSKMDPFAFRAYAERNKISAMTSTILNSSDPVWGDALEMLLPGGTPRPPRLHVMLWDDDCHVNDEPLASGEVQLEEGSGKVEGFALTGTTRKGVELPEVLFDFEYRVELNPEPEPEAEEAAAPAAEE